MGTAGSQRAVLLTLVSVTLLACSGKYAGMWPASVQAIDGHQEGRVGLIAWWAGDMQIISKENADGAYDIYLFTLVLRNTQSAPVTLTGLEWTVSDEDIIRPSPRSQAGTWPIAGAGERRFTWPYSLTCPRLYTCAPFQTVEPTWRFRFTGIDADGAHVEVPITVTLPAQTLRVRFTASIRGPQDLRLATPGPFDSGRGGPHETRSPHNG